MARRGRKSKAGKRTPSGQLSRAGQIMLTIDPNDVVAAKHAVFGTDGADAIGRAHRAGLLGERADEIRDLARSIHRAYWMEFPKPYASCALDVRIPGSAEQTAERAEHIKRVNDRLNRQIAIVNRMGSEYRRAFDQLCIDFFPDFGPEWLDAAIHHSRHDGVSEVRINARLQRAIKALERVLTGDGNSVSAVNTWLEVRHEAHIEAVAA